MTQHKTSAAGVTVPRTGVGVMNYDANAKSKTRSGQLGQLIAAWQTPEAGAPKRVVIRTDGIIVKQGDSGGIPCAVLAVRYAIGGLKRQVLVDPQKQNALVVWAETVDVEPLWDSRRIERLAKYSVEPCPEQQVAASINADGEVGDTGRADARYIDVLANDAQDDTNDWSIHPIPNGARGVRFLNALANGANVKTAALSAFIFFSANTFDKLPTGLIETAINGSTDQSIILVPAGAEWLFVAFPNGTFDTFDTAPWIEWILTPETPPGG